MAGIGFELRKVISSGGLGSFIKAAFSGIMIVAGPWLFSIIGITLIQRFISRLDVNGMLFTGTVIYCYAWSLVIYGGFHFIYTRVLADFLFVKKSNEAAGALISFLLVIWAVSAAIAVPAFMSFRLGIPYEWLLKTAAISLFIIINSMWLIMIFISLLRRYISVLIIYAVGIGAAVLLVWLLSPSLGIAGALAGFVLGHLVIAILLAILAFSAYKPANVGGGFKSMGTYTARFGRLLLTGYLYNGAIWVDKIIFWFTRGEQIEGTFLRVFAQYDVAVYVANLSMIPGLIYFIIVSETSFYLRLRKFLLLLSSGTYAAIESRKRELFRGVSANIAQQAMFQSIVTLGLMFFAPAISAVVGGGETSPLIMRTVLLGVFLHFLALTLMNYHFYLEFFAHALMVSLLFFLGNTVLSLLMTFDIVAFLPGAGYAFGGLIAAVYGYLAIIKSGKHIDRKILAESSGV